MYHTFSLRIGALLLLSTLIFTSCKRNVVRGEGEIAPVTRTISEFSSLDISVPANTKIVLDANAEPSIVITTYPNIADHIETSVVGNSLVVKTDASMQIDGEINIEVHAKSLNALRLTGAANAEMSGAVDSNKFTIDLTGASGLDIEELYTKQLYVDIIGAAELEVGSGSADYAKYDVTGAGEVSAYSLLSNKVDAHITGAGDMKINVSQMLNARISGAGNINYKGAPKIQSDITGVGDLQAVN